MTDITLLPPNRTDWEKAAATVEAERPIPAHLVKTVFNPDTCPVHLLPYLAASLSVDVWDDAWPETKKREVCRKSFALHRIKTTLAGIKAHVALTGAEVKRAIRPPASGFLYAAMTDEQRKAWLEAMPQVRIYPFFSRAIAKSRLFYSGPGLRRQFHGGTVDDVDLSPRFVRETRARTLYGKRATYYDQGVETEVGYEALDGVAAERIFIRGTRKRAWHNGGFSVAFLTGTQANDRVITIRTDESLGLAAIGSGLTPIDVRPQRVSQPRIAPKARAFFGRFHSYPTPTLEDGAGLEAEDEAPLAGLSLGRTSAKRFMLTSYAPLLVYDKISIHDPSRIGARRKTRSFHGHGRFGIADFTAELRVYVPMQRGRRRSGRWHGVGFRMAADMAPLRKAIEAVRVSKAFRDTVMIDTATFGQVKFAGDLRFGEFTFGQIREVR